MTTYPIGFVMAGIFAFIAVAVSDPARAQKPLELQPLSSSQFQLRLDGLAANKTPQVFLGSASVAPNRGFPWVVSIGIKKTSPEMGHFCGGVLIAPNWVLTAAHCVSNPGAAPGAETTKVDPEKIHVLAGSNVLFRGGQIKSVSKIEVHPGHRITAGHVAENDLAMLQLAEPLPQTPIKLATESQSAASLKGGGKIRTLGWGTASSAPNSPLSNNLLYAFTDVVEQPKCNEPGIFDGKVNDSMFCAGLGTAYACQGDSGGPAVAYDQGEPLLVGLVSWGAGCGSKSPTVYAKVVKHSGWIYETIGRSK